MDNLITLSCPSCGANLEVAPGMKQFSCEYCGSTHILPEALAEENSSQSRDKTVLAQKRLMTFFDFNPEDLSCNREGKLSSYQKRRFFLKGLVSFVLLLAGGMISSLAIVIGGLCNQPYVCAKVSLGTFLLIGLINYAFLLRPVAAGVVQNEVGTLGKPSHFTSGAVFYIGREGFPAKGNPFTALEWNIPYRVYYTPARRTVLSIEILKTP